MKQANNNEVDLLLRALARERTSAARQSGSDGGDAENISSDHLDADELNSYAEGLAPAPARARYTEHLADCAACRSVVVGLTQAAGVANRLEAPEQTRGAGFWQRLGEFLSPKVLGYAIPALVLAAVIGIGFVALKQREGTQFVAQNERPVEAPLAAQNKSDSAPGSAAQPQASVQNGIQSGTTSELPREKSALEGEKLQAPLRIRDLMHWNLKPPRPLHQRLSSTLRNPLSLPKNVLKSAKISHAIRTRLSACKRMTCMGPIVPEVIPRNL